MTLTLKVVCLERSRILCFTAIFPGEPELAGFIEAKDGESGGETGAIRRAAVSHGQHVLMPTAAAA